MANTYTKLITLIQKGQYQAAQEFRKPAQALLIHKLEMDEEMRQQLNLLIQEVAASNPAEGTTNYKRLQNLKDIEAGVGVNWDAIDKATRQLGRNPDLDHLGHKDISNLRIHAAEIEKHWPKSKRPPDFNIIMKRYQALIQLLDNINHKHAVLLGDIAGNNAKLEAFIKLLEGKNRVDISATTQMATLSGEAQNLITIDIEDEFENGVKGRVSGALGNLIKQYLTGSKSAQNKIRQVLDKVDIDIHGSPTIIDDIDDIVFDSFYGKETKKKRKRKYAKNGYHKSTKLRKGKKTKVNFNPAKRPRRAPPDLGISLHALLNAVLPEYVKDQMGDPEDPPIKLRNQTGRFAESVEVVGVTSTRGGAVNVLYSIMQNPYGTFLPGGRLYTPERDPSAFVPVAIREAATHLIGKRLRINAELAL